MPSLRGGTTKQSLQLAADYFTSVRNDELFVRQITSLAVVMTETTPRKQNNNRILLCYNKLSQMGFKFKHTVRKGHKNK